MTDIDLDAELGLSYHDGDLNVVIPLAGQVTEMWCQRYEALAQAKDVRATVRAKRDGPVLLHLIVPNGISGLVVRDMLDVARGLIAEADAVDQSPASSDAPEAVVREWWNHQRT